MLNNKIICGLHCCIRSCFAWVIVFLFFAVSSSHAQIVTGKLVGTYRQQHNGVEVTNHFRGYIVLLSMSGHDFVPVVSSLQKGCTDKQASPLEPLYSWSAKNHTFLALNGNFIEPEREYKPGDCQPIIGPLKSNNKVVVGLPSRPDGKGNPALWFDRTYNPKISMLTNQTFRRASNVISGQWRPHINQPVNGSLLINNGVNEPDSALPVPDEAAPRTAAGLTKDGNILILVMIEGRMPGIEGITLPALSQLLKSYGAWNAVNFDGGGSSTMEYIPPHNLQVKESPELYHLIRNAGSILSTDYSLTVTFQQLDSRLPFASTAVNQAGSTSKVHNQLYRPLNVFWGFRIRK